MTLERKDEDQLTVERVKQTAALLNKRRIA